MYQAFKCKKKKWFKLDLVLYKCLSYFFFLPSLGFSYNCLFFYLAESCNQTLSQAFFPPILL